MTAIIFDDPQLATRDLLRSLLAGRPEPAAAGVTVSTRLPAPDGPRPYVQVRSEGRSRDSRLNGSATIRVRVWHRDEGLGEALASLAEALLLDASSDSVRGFTPLVGPLPTEDPDSGEPLSFFTITARLRPSNL
jgi:hypothetical protein